MERSLIAGISMYHQRDRSATRVTKLPNSSYVSLENESSPEVDGTGAESRTTAWYLRLNFKWKQDRDRVPRDATADMQDISSKKCKEYKREE